MASAELSALYSVLNRVVPRAPTACMEWSTHEVLAHLAAGAKERADLIEEALAGLPERGTRPFAEREGRFRTLPDGELRDAVVRETGRFEDAATALARQGAEATIPFTGRRFTAATEAAQRLLIIWGRHPAGRSVDINARMTSRQAMESVLWPGSRPWPEPRQRHRKSQTAIA